MGLSFFLFSCVGVWASRRFVFVKFLYVVAAHVFMYTLSGLLLWKTLFLFSSVDEKWVDYGLKMGCFLSKWGCFF